MLADWFLHHLHHILDVPSSIPTSGDHICVQVISVQGVLYCRGLIEYRYTYSLLRAAL